MKSNAYRKKLLQIDSQPNRVEMTEVTKSSRTGVICANLRTNPSEERIGRSHSQLPLTIKTPKRRAKKTKSKRSQSIKMIVMMKISRDKVAS